ncbi:MAG: protein translocase subunit SecD, partial [Phycisphaerae bacterium]
MNERDLWWKIVIVGTLVALAFASVNPIDEKMKFGIDLAGGYSLLYELDDTGMQGTDRTGLSKRVIEVLRKRVDPNNVFNLVWRPVGHNRIEIQMPRPSADVKEARQKKENLLDQLQATILRRSDVIAAVSRQEEPSVRNARFERLAGGLTARIPLLEAAAKAYDELNAMDIAYQDRVLKIESESLKLEQLVEAVKKPAGERETALAAFGRGIPEREALLAKFAEVGGAYWDAQRAAKNGGEGAAQVPSPEEMVRIKADYESVYKQLMATNIDPEKLTEGATLDEVVRLEEVFDKAVAEVIGTNMELGLLQGILDMKATDKERPIRLKKLTDQYPGLADLINGLVAATDELNKHRRGEGRLEDPADLQRLLKGAGVLDFRILPTGASDPKFDEYRERIAKSGPRPKPGEENYQWFEIENPADFLKLDNLEEDFDKRKMSLSYVVERFGDKYYVLSEIGEGSAMTHSAVKSERDWSLKNSRFTRDRNGGPAIGFTLDEIGGSKFGALTRRHKGRQLCIFLDDMAISSARINSVITTNGIIEGNFTPQEVNDMVKKLNAGSLPQKLKDPPISIRSIGPSLGEANRSAGLRSAQYGAICVAVFMLIYYFYAGGIAVIAVAINILFIGAMMSALGATLTLPGIAGLVLAIGMAVDANVLIFERIREEIARGTALRLALKLGYEPAFRAILDSNVTTVLTCVILYMVGSEQVKGFGLTLGVGVFINIFTAYFITRMFFDMMAMISVPREILRYPLYSALGVMGFGRLLYGLGYLLIDPAEHDRSVSIVFGQAIMEIAPAIAGMLLLMYLARVLHSGRKTLPMLRLIGSPKINWVGRRHVFFGISAIMVVGSLFAFFSLDRDDIYDIEFLGGVSAQIDLKEAGSLDQTQIAERLNESG